VRKKAAVRAFQAIGSRTELIGAHSNGTEPFASLASKVLSNGYSVVPVTPGTKLVPRTESDWRRFCWRAMTPRELKLYERQYADHGLGLACGFHTVGIDIDADDEFLARDLISMAEQTFTKTPLVRGGREPHVSLIYACSEAVMTYMLPWLEILGVGRYVVVHGDHPDTGHPYNWLRGHSPLDTPVWLLPKITQNSVDLYIRAVSPLLGVNYDNIRFDIGQQHMEWMLSSRTQLITQLALAVLRGKQVARTRARKMLADGVFCVPTLTIRSNHRATRSCLSAQSQRDHNRR
jgi:Bifunctional DNA primase/polymerase, N-terminal